MRKRYLDFSAPAEYDSSQVVYTIAIVDLSVSMGSKDYYPTRLTAAIQAIMAMLQEKMKLRPNDKMGVVGFSDRGIRICPLTNVSDSSRIIRSLKNMRTIGATDFIEGLRTAGEMFEEEAGFQQPKPGLLQWLFNQPEFESANQSISRFVSHAIFLSDGEHNGDGNAIRAAKKLRQSGVLLDCIGIGGSPADVNEDCLKAMASTGPDGKPRYRFIGDSQALIQDFRRMATLQVL